MFHKVLFKQKKILIKRNILNNEINNGFINFDVSFSI